MTGTLTGNWLRVGPLVLAFFTVTLTAKGSSTGAATIAGLPVPAAVNVNHNPVLISLHQSLATSPAFECLVSDVTSYIQLGKSGGTSWAALQDTDFTNTSIIQGLAIYQAAQPTG
jgi:hypothetical protein